MKKRLPWIGVVLLSLFLLYLEFVFWYTGTRGTTLYFLMTGLTGVVYGIYRVIYPDKKNDKKE